MSNIHKKDSITIDFIEKEAELLKISAIRFLLLDIIKQHQDKGIYGYQIGEKLSLVTEGDLIGSQAGFYAIYRSRDTQTELQKEMLSKELW